ncbi:MAG TPA: twin transmembrane helix small protein [Woeseiaceae bacterium]|nr:twin transmembrane helix small protein [Woeseiaceae bacterium]
MKLVVLAMLAAIVVSLGAGLFFLYRDQDGSTRVLKALKIRVALSIALIVLLVVAYSLGWMAPRG